VCKSSVQPHLNRWKLNNIKKTRKELEMASVSNSLEGLLNEHDVARITGWSVASVRRWRLLKQGPRFLKLNSAVRYRPEKLASWLDSRPASGEAA
jgi:hypothetical protein